MLLFPLWAYGASGSEELSGWQLGLTVFLYYPPTVATLFFFGWLHRFLSRWPLGSSLELKVLRGTRLHTAEFTPQELKRSA